MLRNNVYMLVFHWHEISLLNAKRPGILNKFSAFLEKEYFGHSKYVRTSGPPCKQVPCMGIIPVPSEYKPKMKARLNVRSSHTRILFNDAVGIYTYTPQRQTVRLINEVVVAYRGAAILEFPWRNWGKYKKIHSRQPVFRPRFESNTSRI
jgi:hypothetical protein